MSWGVETGFASGLSSRSAFTPSLAQHQRHQITTTTISTAARFAVFSITTALMSFTSSDIHTKARMSVRAGVVAGAGRRLMARIIFSFFCSLTLSPDATIYHPHEHAHHHHHTAFTLTLVNPTNHQPCTPPRPRSGNVLQVGRSQPPKIVSLLFVSPFCSHKLSMTALSPKLIDDAHHPLVACNCHPTAPGLPRAEQRYYAVHHCLNAANPLRDALAGACHVPRAMHPSPRVMHSSPGADGRSGAACSPQHYLSTMDSSGQLVPPQSAYLHVLSLTQMNTLKWCIPHHR